MKILILAVAVLVGSMGHAMSQPVAQLEAPRGEPLAQFFRDQVPAQNAHVRMPAGTYKVTPSILNSNLYWGSRFSGVTLGDRTNLVIEGVPGLTIWDGSSAPGELLWISNVYNVKFIGITFRGYTNHNFTELPTWGGNVASNSYLWAGVNYYKAQHLTFDNCIVERHADHGIQDKGAESNASGEQLATAEISTNAVQILNCTFRDIGGWRTNFLRNGTISSDGTAVVCTGARVQNCVFENVWRGIEPYNEGDSNAVVFTNCELIDNRFYNVSSFAIGFAGSTNGHNVRMAGNTVRNELTFSYHGTNWGAGGIPALATGFFINGGRGHYIANNEARGGMYLGFYLLNSSSGFYDTTVEGNTAVDIDRGDGAGNGFVFGDSSNTAAATSSFRRCIVRNNKAIRTVGAGFILNTGRDVLFEGNHAIRASAYLAVNPGYAAFRFGTADNTAANVTNVVVRNNIADDAGAGAAYGFAFENSVQSAINENNVALNYAANGGFTNRSGAAVVTLGQPRYFSATIDLPSIGTAAQFTTNFTASGVTTNDLVLLQFPSDLYASGNTSNLVVTAWASNSVVYVKAANNDAVSAANAPSTRFTAIVRQAAIHGQ